MFTIGQILNDYKIISPLGHPSGYAKVYKVSNVKNKSEAALKECYGRTQDELDRFDVENNILYKLKNHDYIIMPLSSVILEGSIKYFLLELADENLADFLNKNYNLSVGDKMELFIKICEGIGYAHSKGIVHRDIWWNNILIMNQQPCSIPKITDFGRSRDFNVAQLTSLPPEKWGLPDISQPELYFRYWDNPTQQNYIFGDIYALGVLLYYSLEVGPLPYSFCFYYSIAKYLRARGIDIAKTQETDRQRIYKEWLKTINYSYLDSLRNLPSHSPAFIQKIDPILKKMCNPDFSQRYTSMNELIIDLRQV
jgi:non-specific serine/threonine protein kinase/serine/threonine-protein kinase